MTALFVALVMVWIVNELGKDRKVYDCTLCDNGVIWKGEHWVHVGGSRMAHNRPPSTLIHPAIPITHC